MKNKMKKVEKGHHVMVHYTGKLLDGTVFDTSYKRGEPLHFAVGAGQMIKGFDVAVEGMIVGEKKTVPLPPEEAYGHAREDLIHELERKVFGDLEPVVGQRYMLGQYPITVSKVTETHVIADLNHELAGKTLVFEIEVVDVHDHHH